MIIELIFKLYKTVGDQNSYHKLIMNIFDGDINLFFRESILRHFLSSSLFSIIEFTRENIHLNVLYTC